MAACRALQEEGKETCKEVQQNDGCDSSVYRGSVLLPRLASSEMSSSSGSIGVREECDGGEGSEDPQRGRAAAAGEDQCPLGHAEEDDP
jgi:hypothetical protein